MVEGCGAIEYRPSGTLLFTAMLSLAHLLNQARALTTNLKGLHLKCKPKARNQTKHGMNYCTGRKEAARVTMPECWRGCLQRL